MQAHALSVAGVTPFTTIDFPGRLAAVVFCKGCLWNCPYCHNAHLRAFGPGTVAWADVLAFLRRRVGILNGVVFSGGEPTAQAALPAAMADVKALGFSVGLHSAGMLPEAFAQALAQADWVGLDIKGPFGDIYNHIAGHPAASDAAKSSLRLLLASKKPYQLRTTVDPARLNPDDLALMDAQLFDMGAAASVRQTMRLPESSPAV